MKIKDVQFSGSSTRVSGRPSPRLPEFAFIGRSNVGKSSLINMLCQRKGLAKTSQTPGKTRLVNHFAVDGKWYLVDLPGYGYAKASDRERKEISAVIEDYILGSDDLVLLFVLVDARHDLGRTDLDFMIRLAQAEVPFSIIFTQADQLGPVALQRRIDGVKAVLSEHWEILPEMFATSSESGLGRDAVLTYIADILKTL